MTVLRHRILPSTARTSDGFIVVAVLWILGALATLASIYAVYVINTATSMSVNDDRLQAEALVTAALELTAYRVTAAGTDNRPSRGEFLFRQGNANVAVALLNYEFSHCFCRRRTRIGQTMKPLPIAPLVWPMHRAKRRLPMSAS